MFLLIVMILMQLTIFYDFDDLIILITYFDYFDVIDNFNTDFKYDFDDFRLFELHIIFFYNLNGLENIE